MFIRVEGTGIDIDVWIELLNGHRMPARLKQFGNDALKSLFRLELTPPVTKMWQLLRTVSGSDEEESEGLFEAWSRI